MLGFLLLQCFNRSSWQLVWIMDSPGIWCCSGSLPSWMFCFASKGIQSRCVKGLLHNTCLQSTDTNVCELSSLKTFPVAKLQGPEKTSEWVRRKQEKMDLQLVLVTFLRVMSCSGAFCCPCKLSWASKVSSDWPRQIPQIEIQKGAASRRCFTQASERGCYLHLPMVSPPFDVSRDSHLADGHGFTPFYISITNLTSLWHKLHLLQGSLFILPAHIS